jgi:O-antigen/teichoic acid export membrane protein
MSRSSVILRNISSNWIGYAANALVTLILTPFVLHQLGDARYGVWILTVSIIGHFGLLDLGFRGGVTQFLTKYLAVRDYRKASECLSSAVKAFSALGFFLVFLSIAAVYIAPLVFDFPPGLKYETSWCIFIVGLSSAIQFAFFPFASIFPSMQRFDLDNLIGIWTRLLTAGSIYLALKMNYGLIGVSVATCGANLLDYIIRWRVSMRLTPELNVSWHLAKIDRLKEIGSFGVWNFLISINAYSFQYLPSIMIGAFMPVAAVGYYALAMGLLRNINSVLSPVAQVLYPAAVELHAKGDNQGLERLYHRGSRLMLLLMISVVLIAMFWAEDFYRLWIGEKYLIGSEFTSVALLLQILLISTMTSYVSSIASQILVAAGYVRVVAIALICGTILNLSLNVILIGNFGLIGIAISTVIASIVIDLIAVPLLLEKFVGFSVKEFLLSSCMRPVSTGLLQALLIIFIRLVGKPEDWFHLFLQGSIAGVGSTFAVFILGLTAAERERFVLRPVQRIFG